MGTTHHYQTQLDWTGNQGSGTSAYAAYSRSHRISIPGKPTILASADPAFRGDPKAHNPEELLVASLSSCHMLWYLHLCANEDIIVEAYEDEATGTMEELANGGGNFSLVTLHPSVKVADEEMKAVALELHERAHELCFIARSVNFPVETKPHIYT